MTKAKKSKLVRNLAAVIKKLRLELELTQAEFAGRSGLNRPYMCNVENGKKNPSFIVVMDIGAAANMSPREFFAYLSENFEES